MHKYRSTIIDYVSGWKDGDEARILGTLTDNAEVIESHGPVYKGKDLIKKWIQDWRSDGGKVVAWDITSYFEIDDTVFFEWEFDYMFHEKKDHISGITIARILNSKIMYLREYRTTEPLFNYE